MNDLRSIVTGGLIGASVVILALYMVKPEPQPKNPQSDFEVVDTYKGCDVVRWALPNHAEYKYFLHCGQ
jgi:hypothetical protein